MTKLIEYRIETESSLKKVYLMWKRFFQNDFLWHFCLEGSYIEIRLSKKNKKLETYLKNKKWNYTSFSYVDAIDTTRKYQKSYQKIFNGYAEICMRILDENKGKKKSDVRMKERDNSIERAIHLCFNLFGINNVDESLWLSNYAVNRARSTGYYEGLEKAKEKK